VLVSNIHAGTPSCQRDFEQARKGRLEMKVCKICGEIEGEHHEHDWMDIPDGCVCDWREWSYAEMAALPPVCDEHQGNPERNCMRCEHDMKCHKPKKGG
jgi:hypothetical protein